MEALVKPVRRVPWLPLLLAAVYGIAGLWILKDYLDWRSANVVIGLLALPFALMPVQARKPGRRLALLAAALLLFSFIAPVKTALFFAWCSLLLFLYEQSGRRVGLPVLLILFLMSPVCQYFTQVFSFPLRLQLTEVSGALLRYAGQPVAVAGNMITYKGNEFSVDPACMGLHMVITSLLCGLILVAVQQRRSGLRLPGYWIMALLLILLLLNTGANLLRILLLVYFQILPGNPLHDICGLLCLLLYVLLPAFFLVRMLVALRGKPFAVAAYTPDPFPLAAHRSHLVLLPLLLLSLQHYRQQKAKPVNKALPALEAYQVSWYDQDVIKIAGSQSLVYVKPLKGAVYTDHNPLICWTGSGYLFSGIQEQQWDDLVVFTGVLKKGTELLYTAWWYDNGQTTTLSQWRWRRDMLQGSPAYSIVNVTAGNAETLRSEVSAIYALRGRIFDRKQPTDISAAPAYN